MNPRVLFIGLAALLSACDQAAPEDGGNARLDAGADAMVQLCASDLDCRQSFCEPSQCRPGTGGDGCVAAPSPCASGEMCDGTAEVCVPAECVGTRDADGDGHESLACGGNDCDDADPERYGGNGEVCDSMGHDEDCVVETVGDRDADEDGFVDAMCCNGAECGLDCDDSLADVRPGVAELCNGRDDDCDGMTDEEGAEPLCPGGTCAGGGCRLSAWDHTLDAYWPILALDPRANVYVAASFSGTTRFDGGPLTATEGDDHVLVAYDSDGTHRWDLHAAGSTAIGALAAPGASVFVAGAFRDALELGDFTEAAAGPHLFVAELDARDGSVIRHVRISGAANARGLAVSGDFVYLVGNADRTTIESTPVHEGFLVVLDATSLAVSRVVGWTGVASFRALEPRSGGGFVMASVAFGPVDLGCTPTTGGSGLDTGFVAGFGPGGACDWVYSLDGTHDFWDVAVDGSENVLVAADFGSSIDFGGGVRMAVSGGNGVILALDAGGAYLWDRIFDSPNGALTGLDDTSDGVLAVGQFHTRINIGGSTLAGSSDGDSVLVELSPTGAVRRTRTFMSDNSDRAIDVVVGRGGSTVVIGEFTGSLTLGTGTFLGPAVYVTRLPSG